MGLYEGLDTFYGCFLHVFQAPLKTNYKGKCIKRCLSVIIIKIRKFVLFFILIAYEKLSQGQLKGYYFFTTHNQIYWTGIDRGSVRVYPMSVIGVKSSPCSSSRIKGSTSQILSTSVQRFSRESGTDKNTELYYNTRYGMDVCIESNTRTK